MQRRITDVFAQILSQNSQSEADDPDATGGHQSTDEEYDVMPEWKRQEVLATYKNLYWTRVISVSHFDEEADKRCSMGLDLTHEMNELAEI